MGVVGKDRRDLSWSILSRCTFSSGNMGFASNLLLHIADLMLCDQENLGILESTFLFKVIASLEIFLHSIFFYSSAVVTGLK